ncbi:hypothetical protein [Streptomyces hydrogenans]
MPPRSRTRPRRLRALTAALAASRRPGGTDDLFVAREALTHARNPTPA